MITRRNMLGLMLAAAAGPAIVRASSLMAIRQILPPFTISTFSREWPLNQLPSTIEEIAKLLTACNEVMKDMPYITENREYGLVLV